MSKLKIYCEGARFHSGQIQRIEQGFRELGHEVTPYVSEADLLYVNNPPFGQVLADKAGGRLKPGAKVICDVQDIPHHIPSFDKAVLAASLAQADAVTAISETTKQDVEAIGVKVHGIVYQPIMPIVRTGIKTYPYKVLFVGRVNDRNKGSLYAAAALQNLGFNPTEIVTVGMEPPAYRGDFWGVANEAQLNALYNSVDFVCCFSRFEGIGLPMIEAMAAGAIPLVCNDLSTRQEFLPSSLFPEYDAIERTPQSLSLFIARYLQDNDAMDKMKARLYAHYTTRWQEPFSPRGVAKRIIGVYEGLLILPESPAQT